MLPIEDDAMLIEDREDLIAVLRMRFGEISGEVIQKIYDISDMSTLQRLILAAANARNYQVFQEELEAGSASFKLTGERLNPLGDMLKGGRA